MRYTILTYIFDNYEKIKEPLEVSENCDYILVTDNQNLKSNFWKIKQIPDKFKNASSFTKTDFVKYFPFSFTNNKICIVLDGSVQIKKPLDKLINAFEKSDKDIALVHHWYHRNAFEEYSYWVNYRGYDRITAAKNASTMKLLGYSDNINTYFESGFKICRNDIITKSFLKTVFSYLEKTGKRNQVDRLDQTILTGVKCCLYEEMTVFSLTHEIFQNEYLSLCRHNSNHPVICNVKFKDYFINGIKVDPYFLS